MTTEPTPPPASATGDPPEPKGDPAEELRKLQSALVAERKARKGVETELAQVRSGAGADDDRLGALQRRVLLAEVRARATARLADPNDSIALLDLDQFTPDDAGEYDGAAIDAALDELVKAKPYLARGRVPRMPQGVRPDLGSADPLGDWLRKV